MSKSMELPAKYANAITVSQTGDGTRLSFGEAEFGPDGRPIAERYHTAVVISGTNAERLCEIIRSSQEKFEEAIAAMKTKQ